MVDAIIRGQIIILRRKIINRITITCDATGNKMSIVIVDLFIR